MLVSDQITLINTSYNMLTTYRCGVRARQHHAVQTVLTTLPACHGPDPRGILTWTVFASPGAGNMLFLPPLQQQIITEQMEVCQEVPHCL